MRAAATFTEWLRTHPSQTWTPHATTVGDIVHVAPCKGTAEMVNWPMGLRWWERRRGGGNYRLMYPKTEEQVRRSFALCVLWCERENAAEVRAQDIARRATDDFDFEERDRFDADRDTASDLAREQGAP